jgi:hypothetical protein
MHEAGELTTFTNFVFLKGESLNFNDFFLEHEVWEKRNGREGGHMAIIYTGRF